MAAMLALLFSSLFSVTLSQVTQTNVHFCYDDPRLEFVGFSARNEQNITEFAVKGINFEHRIRGMLRTFSHGFYPQTIISEENIDEDSNFPLDILQTDEPESATITAKEFLYFRNVKNQKYRLLGFAQEFLGCPAPLCFSSALDAANVYIGSGNSHQLHVFRGKWFWDISSPPLVHNARMIGEAFLGMPDNIEAAFSIGSEDKQDLEVYFFKEDWVYVKFNKLWPRRFKIVNMFQLNGRRLTAVNSAFPLSHEANDKSKVLLLSGAQLFTFIYNTSYHSWFADDKIGPLKLRSELINSDAAYSMIFSSDAAKNNVYFFKSWICQQSSMDDFPQGINKVQLKVTLSMEEPFNCPSDLYYNQKIGITSIEDYKELYVTQLLADHDRSLWQQIGISKEGRRGYVVIAAIVLATSFMIPLTAMIWFIFSSIQWRRKSREKAFYKEREPRSQIVEPTTSNLLGLGYSPSQLVRAGVATPSMVGANSPPQSQIPSTLVDRGYYTRNTTPPVMQEATPSTLLAVGYSPSQLVGAGIATPSMVGLRPKSQKGPSTIGHVSVEPTTAKSYHEPSNVLSKAFTTSRSAIKSKKSKQEAKAASVVGLSNVFSEISKIAFRTPTRSKHEKAEAVSGKASSQPKSAVPRISATKSGLSPSKSSKPGSQKLTSLPKKSSDKKTSKVSKTETEKQNSLALGSKPQSLPKKSSDKKTSKASKPSKASKQSNVDSLALN